MTMLLDRTPTARQRPKRAGVASAPAWIALLGVLTTAVPPAAQDSSGGFNPRDEQFRALGLLRAQSEFERAEAALARAEELHRLGVISTQELEDRRGAFERARVDYFQQSLAVAMAAPRMAVERATRRRTADGRSEVSVTLRNVTVAPEPGAQQARLAPEVLQQWQPSHVSAVAVSLKADPGPGGTTLSSPFERVVPRLAAGQAATLTFRLLREVDEVVVSLQYNERVEERRVLLEMDASEQALAMQSVQFSQEADLGAQAVYDLLIERFTHAENTFRLAVDGLPGEVRHEFRDPDNGARLNQLRFPAGETQRTLQLVLSLPQRATPGLRMDEPIAFEVAAFAGADPPTGMIAALGSGSDAIVGAGAGRARLELIPRGVGRFQVRAVNLYHEVRRGEAVTMAASLRNIGTHVIHGVRLRLDVPTGWAATIEPETLAELPVGAEQPVEIRITPPPDVLVGDYEARLRTESTAAERRIETDDKTVRIHVAGSTHWLGTSALVLLLTGLVTAVVAAGIRLARR